MTNPFVVPGRWGVGWIPPTPVRPQPTAKPVGWFADDKQVARGVAESYSIGLSDPDTDAFADSYSICTALLSIQDTVSGLADSRSTPACSALLSNLISVPISVTGVADSRSDPEASVVFQVVAAASVTGIADSRSVVSVVSSSVVGGAADVTAVADSRSAPSAQVVFEVKMAAAAESYSLGLSDPDTDAFADSYSIGIASVNVAAEVSGLADSRSTPAATAAVSNVVASAVSVTGLADSRSTPAVVSSGSASATGSVTGQADSRSTPSVVSAASNVAIPPATVTGRADSRSTPSVVSSASNVAIPPATVTGQADSRSTPSVVSAASNVVVAAVTVTGQADSRSTPSVVSAASNVTVPPVAVTGSADSVSDPDADSDFDVVWPPLVPVSIPIPYTPWGVYSTADHSKVYVTHARGFSVIDTVTNTVTRTITSGATADIKHFAALSADEKTLYLSGGSNKNIQVYDTDTLNLRRTITSSLTVVAGLTLNRIEIKPDESRIFVHTTYGSGQIRYIDVATGASATAAITTGQDMCLNKAGTVMYTVDNAASSQLRLNKLDISGAGNPTALQTATLVPGVTNAGAGLSRAETRMYVACGNGTVAVVNTANMGSAGTITGIAGASALTGPALDESDRILFCSKDTNTIVAIDPATNTVAETLPMPNTDRGPVSLAVSHEGVRERVWVACQTTRTVLMTPVKSSTASLTKPGTYEIDVPAGTTAIHLGVLGGGAGGHAAKAVLSGGFWGAGGNGGRWRIANDLQVSTLLPVGGKAEDLFLSVTVGAGGDGGKVALLAGSPTPPTAGQDSVVQIMRRQGGGLPPVLVQTYTGVAGAVQVNNAGSSTTHSPGLAPTAGNAGGGKDALINKVLYKGGDRIQGQTILGITTPSSPGTPGNKPGGGGEGGYTGFNGGSGGSGAVFAAFTANTFRDASPYGFEPPVEVVVKESVEGEVGSVSGASAEAVLSKVRLASFIAGWNTDLGTTAELPDHNPGDLILVWAHRRGTGSSLVPPDSRAPTIPAFNPAGGVPQFTNLYGIAGTNNPDGVIGYTQRWAYAIATTNNHNIGTWVGAAAVTVWVVRNVAAQPIGSFQVSTGQVTGAAPTFNVPGLTLQKTDGTSLIMRAVGVGSMSKVPAGPVTGVTWAGTLDYEWANSDFTLLQAVQTTKSATAPAASMQIASALPASKQLITSFKTFTLEILAKPPASTTVGKTTALKFAYEHEPGYDDGNPYTEEEA